MLCLFLNSIHEIFNRVVIFLKSQKVIKYVCKLKRNTHVAMEREDFDIGVDGNGDYLC